MKLVEYNKQRDTIADWATPESAGRAALAWQARINEINVDSAESGPLFTVDFGESEFTLSTNGTEFKPNVTDDDNHRRTPRMPVGMHIQTPIPVGSAPTNKMVGNFRIPCGLVLIIAGGDAGKTPMAHALAGANGSDYGIVRYGEPLAGYLADGMLGAHSMALAMYSYTDVVVDSVKDVLAFAGGGAMKSGISRAALPLLSRWGAMAAAMGRTLYVPLNPSSPDTEVIDLLVEAAKSNSTTAIFAKGPNAWEYVSRRGEGLQRERGDFTTSFDNHGNMNINGVSTIGNAPTKEDGSQPPVVLQLSDKEYSQAIRRAIQTM